MECCPSSSLAAALYLQASELIDSAAAGLDSIIPVLPPCLMGTNKYKLSLENRVEKASAEGQVQQRARRNTSGPKVRRKPVLMCSEDDLGLALLAARVAWTLSEPEWAEKMYDAIQRIQPTNKAAEHGLILLKKVEATKKAGNDSYKSDKLENADKLYTAAINAVKNASQSLENELGCSFAAKQASGSRGRNVPFWALSLGKVEWNSTILSYLHGNRGAARMALGKVAEAVKDCTQSLTYRSSHYKVKWRRAHLYCKLSMHSQARNDYKSALALVQERIKLMRDWNLKNLRKDFGLNGDNVTALKQTYSEIQKELTEFERLRQKEEEERKRTERAREQQKVWERQQKKQYKEWFDQNRREGANNPPPRRDAYGSGGYRSARGHYRSGSSKSGGGSSRERSRRSETPPASPDTPNHYKVLGVATSATTSEIKKAYRKLALL